MGTEKFLEPVKGSTVQIDGTVSDWKYKNASYTAVVGDKLFCDTTDNAFPVHFPISNLVRGDTIKIKDFNGNFNSSNLTVIATPVGIRNSGADLALTTNWDNKEFIYSGNATVGWVY